MSKNARPMWRTRKIVFIFRRDQVTTAIFRLHGVVLLPPLCCCCGHSRNRIISLQWWRQNVVEYQDMFWNQIEAGKRWQTVYKRLKFTFSCKQMSMLRRLCKRSVENLLALNGHQKKRNKRNCSPIDIRMCIWQPLAIGANTITVSLKCSKYISIHQFEPCVLCFDWNNS